MFQVARGGVQSQRDDVVGELYNAEFTYSVSAVLYLPPGKVRCVKGDDNDK